MKSRFFEYLQVNIFHQIKTCQKPFWRGLGVYLVLLAGLLAGQTSWALQIDVVGSDGQVVRNYRWLIEEDATYQVQPGVPDPKTLAVKFHTSYMPVKANGRTRQGTGSVQVTLDAAKRYFLTVMPDAGYSLAGVNIAPGQTQARVTPQPLPLPTAQVSVFVYEDDHPLNGQPDLPQEAGLEGFKVFIYDAGGRYGVSGGQMMMDTFGHPIGTVYDAMGGVQQMGQGFVMTDVNGEALIKNLAPGKFTIFVSPPSGPGWIQTETIEGTRGIDAWVKPGEPKFFMEFGPPGYHVTVGFAKPLENRTVLKAGRTVRGKVVNLHTSRPPDYTFFPGEPVPGAWVALNETGAAGQVLFAAPCDKADSTFFIHNVPPGDYQLAFWDENLDIIFASKNITVSAGQDLNLGNIPVFNWFARLNERVFLDKNENGFPDPDEPGIPDQTLNIRWRDGSIYQTATTNAEGKFTFTEVFPFFNWLVAEVDYTRYKPTGNTVVVDNGGAIRPDQGWTWPSRGVLTPQPQFNPDHSPAINPYTGNNLSRTERGPFPLLLEGFQAFLGTTNVIEWGKTTYDKVDVDRAPKGNFPGPEDTDWNGNGEFDGSNGGIAGIIYYATTRAEDDPRLNAAETWEPGIPRVQVNLYTDYDRNGVIDDLNRDGKVTLADVDNYPFTWRQAPYQKGPEDIDRNGNSSFDYGDAINVTATDSWDDSPPTGAQGPPFIHQGVATDAYDGLRNFNQVRPAVFDGGYIFTKSSPLASENLPEGTYIVEAVPPPGYQIVKEEDKNVNFGETFQASPLARPPVCVGDPHLVPAELSLFPGVPSKFAGQTRPLADRKQVQVGPGQNTPCDFHMFTEVPVAGHIVGIILDDLANEFDRNSPVFGEKYSPPWLPISIRDWTGREISRVYSDQYGAYNALVPSTFNINAPIPSGVSPGMYTVVLNSPGPILDTRPGSPTNGQFITDPFFNRQYSQFSYTFQYMPGTTTYLDTPVMRIAAFAGPDQNPLDLEQPDGTPVIWSVSGPGGGPYVAQAGQAITVASAGKVEVPNPLYVTGGSQPKTITRDYGFGAGAGRIVLNGVMLTNVVWTDGSISATVPAGTTTGELSITRSNGRSTAAGITVTVGPITGTVRQVRPSSNPAAHPIQDAIDLARPGDLILVAPGKYDECVILWKPVQLQGWGAASTIVNAVKTPSEKLQAWRDKVRNLVITGAIDLLPGQTIDFSSSEPATLASEEGSGILVLARNAAPAQGGFGAVNRARIDGLTVTGGDNGGGIVIHGYARYLEVSNNVITGNQGIYGGGIRAGNPELTIETGTGLDYVSSENLALFIHHNEIKGNGGLGGAGGGISLYTGCDQYTIAYNTIVGNFTPGNGGGIGQSGVCFGSRILSNTILFNQSFDQGTNPGGGGIYIGGAPSLVVGGLSPGSGSVKITDNLIQGNQAGAGDGGGILLESINGLDVGNNPNTGDDPAHYDDFFPVGTTTNSWWRIDVVDNTIVNNQAGLAGGGISMRDTAIVNIIHNTIARNESTGTAGTAFAPGSPNQSTPQPAGVVGHAHSAALAAAFGKLAVIRPFATFSNPRLVNNIIWQNRSFYFYVNNALTPPFGLAPSAASPAYNDLAVLGLAGARLNPLYCLLTDRTGYDASNVTGDPAFAASYFNGDRGQTLVIPEATTQMGTVPAFDEGGNFIDVRFGPLTTINPATRLPYGDYHIKATSAARDHGNAIVRGLLAEIQFDADGQPRPNGAYDIGADEYYTSWGVSPVPNALNEQYTTKAGQSLTIFAPGVLANDLSASGQPLQAIRAAGPSRGVLIFQASGGFSYSPNTGFSGSDSFTYKASDGISQSDNARVTIRVTAAGNTAPNAVDDRYSVVPGRVLAVRSRGGVLANDSDINGDTFFAILSQGAGHGTVALQGDGSFTYTPLTGYIGTDTFKYRAFDGAYSRIATVTVTIGTTGAPNRPPAPTAAGIDTMMDTTGYTRVMPNDPDPKNTFSYALTVAPTHGQATLSPTGIVTYKPTAGYLGNDTLTVRVTDQGGLNASAAAAIIVRDMIMAPGGVFTQFKADTDGVDTDGDGVANNDNVTRHLGGGDGFVKMADGVLTYVFGFSDLNGVPNDKAMMDGMVKAECPGPTLRFKQGQRVYLNLTNVGMAIRPDLFDAHTIHFHGFPQAAPIFDGMPDAAPAIKMGNTFTFYYQINDPGTYMYHCHVEATEHMQMGMLGNLIVTPLQDGRRFEYPLGSGRFYTRFAYNDGDGSTGYDLDYPIQIDSFDPDFHQAELEIQPLPMALMRDKYPLLNGRGYPDTLNTSPLPALDESLGRPSQKMSSLIEARQGQRILLRLSNLNVTRFYTLQSTGIPMQVVGVNAKLLRDAQGGSMYYGTQSLTTGGGESYDVILDTAGVAPGTYFLYTTNLNYLSNNQEDFGGMMTQIVVR